MKTAKSPWGRIPKTGEHPEENGEAEPKSTARKKREKAVGESAKKTMSVLKGIIASPIAPREAMTEEERVSFAKEAAMALRLEGQKEPSALGRECQEFLGTVREENLRKGLSPERIESHADLQKLEEVVNLGGSHLKLAKGNWIQLDLGDKAKNEILKQALEQCGEPVNDRLTKPSIGPAGFLRHIDGLVEILKKSQSEKGGSRKLTNQARVLAWAAMALLEIWEEEAEDPLEEATGKSSRPPRAGKERIGLFKRLLLEQSLEEEPPADTPRLSEKEMEDRLGLHGRRELTASEAAYLAAVCSELELEKLKSSKKRETLFKMRAWMASRFYEVAKKHREEGHSSNDFILPQKPRYKTPCLFLARHKPHERIEVVAIKPRDNVAYWGNPESEKENYALLRVPQEEKKSLWGKWRPKPEEVGKKVLEYQEWIAWAAVAITALLLLAGILKSRNQERTPEVPAAVQTEGASLPASEPRTNTEGGMPPESSAPNPKRASEPAAQNSRKVEPLPEIEPTGRSTSLEWSQ